MSWLCSTADTEAQDAAGAAANAPQPTAVETSQQQPAAVPEPPAPAVAETPVDAAPPASDAVPPAAAPSEVATTPAPTTPALTAPSADALPEPPAPYDAPFPALFPLDVHAFVSQGFLLSTGNNYLARSKDGSFEFTEAAINFTKSVTDDLRLGMQLFSRKVGPTGSYAPYFDWYYLDYHVADWLGIRAGRTKIPFGLYNESNDVDAGHVPVLLPQSLYPSHHREILLAVTGGELYGNFRLGALGQLEYRAYGGTFSLDALGLTKPNVTIRDVKTHYLAGGRLMWLTPLDGLQVGASFQKLRYEFTSVLDPAVTDLFVMLGLAPMGFDGVVKLDFPIQLWVASAEYAVGDLLVAAEYGRWWADLKSSVPTLIPSAGPVNERYYVMGSYRFLPWLTPGVYYSGYYEDREHREGRAKYSHDFAATLRFDFNAFWLLKLEAHLMRGTAALDEALNGGKELKTLERDWALFLVKTTAYF
jgi:hypothetical protein